MIRQAKLKDAERVRLLLEQLGYCPELTQVEQVLADSTLPQYDRVFKQSNNN